MITFEQAGDLVQLHVRANKYVPECCKMDTRFVRNNPTNFVIASDIRYTNNFAILYSQVEEMLENGTLGKYILDMERKVAREIAEQFRDISDEIEKRLKEGEDG